MDIARTTQCCMTDLEQYMAKANANNFLWRTHKLLNRFTGSQRSGGEEKGVMTVACSLVLNFLHAQGREGGSAGSF